MCGGQPGGGVESAVKGKGAGAVRSAEGRGWNVSMGGVQCGMDACMRVVEAMWAMATAVFVGAVHNQANWKFGSV
eukprot:10365932-Prorocentrum_lima.AAC.1